MTDLTDKYARLTVAEDKFVLDKLEPVPYEEIPACASCGQLIPDETKRVSKERRVLQYGAFCTYTACSEECLARAIRASEMADEDAARALGLESSGTKVMSL